MSPRRTRAATAEQSVFTRSKGQKINNVSQDVAKSAQKIRQSQKKKSASVKKNLEAAAKQSVRKESPDVEVTFVMKKTTRRRLNLDKGAETDNTPIKNRNVNSDESIRILRDRYCDNITVDLVKNNLFQPASKDLDSEKMSNEKLQRKTSSTNAKITPVIVTPKSTPPKLSLTPHRSKKTPKKSPISLGSPKTHSIAIPKLFKSPRKLSLAATGEDSGENLEKSDSDSHKKSRKRNKHSSGSSSMSDKSLLISPTAKNKQKKSDVNLKLVVRKFSKSPKIVLKSPKSKKSKSHKLKLLSPSRVRKSTPKKSTSPNTTPNLNKSSKISTKESPLSKRKSLSPIKRRLLGSKLTKTLTASQMKDVLAEPIVLLEKLSPESMKRKNMLMVASKTRSNTLIKVRSPSISARSNSKVLIKKVSVGSGVSTDRNSNTKLRNSMEKSQINNTNRISPRIKYNTSIQEKDRSIPLMASTPREEKITLMDTSLTFNTSITSVNDTSFNTRLRHRNQSNLQLSDTRDKNTNIENVSEPSLFDMEISNTSQSRLSNVTKRNATYEKVNTMEKKQENRDNTYELEQPQTLSLRKMIKKRTSIDANLSLRSNTAKKAKVRFADASSGAGSAKKSIDKLNGSRSSISHNVNARSSNIRNSAHKLKKVETPKFSRNSLISPFKRSSPRTHEGTPKVQLNRAEVTPKTFASTEKKSEKKSSTKKVPNFGKIHEQMFAKSESLVDAKNRLKARHLAFTANKAISDVKREEKKPLPTETRDGIHNRYGFKLKKPEATNIMLKKQTVFPRQKQQHETRMMLKGVRTNRRFELQMKARNLAS